MNSRHQRNICQIIHKIKKKTKSSQNFEMLCYAAATDADAGLDWYCEIWYCHICCCCCCCGCVGMSCCSCFIIIADEVAAGRPTCGRYPGLHTCCGICESTRDETKRDRSDPTLEGRGRRDAGGSSWAGVRSNAEKFG